MSTRATIAIENNDRTVNWIYNHNDGYISHLGKVLVESYITREKVNELIELGAASFIDHELAGCEFYHRDRNEEREYNAPAMNVSQEEWRNNFEAYNYLFDLDNQWKVQYYKRGSASSEEFFPLKFELKEIEEEGE